MPQTTKLKPWEAEIWAEPSRWGYLKTPPAENASGVSRCTRKMVRLTNPFRSSPAGLDDFPVGARDQWELFHSVVQVAQQVEGGANVAGRVDEELEIG